VSVSRKFSQPSTFAPETSSWSRAHNTTLQAGELVSQQSTSLRWLKEIHNNLHLSGQLLCIQCPSCHMHSYHSLFRR